MTTQVANAPQAPPAKTGLSDRAKREERLAYLFLIPTLVVVIGVAFYPLAQTVYVTFFEAKHHGVSPFKKGCNAT